MCSYNKNTYREKMYKIINVIFHYGENINSGHYTNMIRAKASEQISIDDSKVDKCNWARNAKNAYIFSLKKYNVIRMHLLLL